MRFSILTLFPEYFESPLKCSLLGRAREAGLLEFDLLALREFGEGKYRAVDDRPFGGGAGMVMMPQVLEKAFEELAKRTAAAAPKPHVIYLSPQGNTLTAARARELAHKPHLALLCGHYEGIDERAIEEFVDEEISIGDYVLSGGEPAAMVLLDAVSRFVPAVVGEGSSVAGDTFERQAPGAPEVKAALPEMVPGGLKAPVYTRPRSWRGREVPAVLLSGNHAEIARWRYAQSLERTRARRPDLLEDLKG
ncbi:MAG: tRNA (guanosine(37)-N1)-methyltransferase TrmD [Deltaproteobacteria bacterium]|nr:tRNA (guanosine(37)-N1)-methyltransferase TrmD [Deltaproteobacteria bacterium]